MLSSSASATTQRFRRARRLRTNTPAMRPFDSASAARCQRSRPLDERRSACPGRPDRRRGGAAPFAGPLVLPEPEAASGGRGSEERRGGAGASRLVTVPPPFPVARGGHPPPPAFSVSPPPRAPGPRGQGVAPPPFPSPKGEFGLLVPWGGSGFWRGAGPSSRLLSPVGGGGPRGAPRRLLGGAGGDGPRGPPLAPPAPSVLY